MRKNRTTRKEATIKRPGTSVDDVYRTLYERIIAGRYPPRFRMSQLELAEELKVSRTPLREALNRLQAGGLLVADANRGMEVAPLHNADAEEGYSARLLLEPALVASLVPLFSGRDFDEMARALDEMERAGHRNREFQKAHLAFHTVALRRYPKTIREIVLSLYDKNHRHQCVHFSRPRIPQDFIDIDRSFLQAIRAGDTSNVRQLLEFHLIDASLGMALDIDPRHVPSSLVLAASGVGIELDIASQDGEIQRPVSMHWRRGGAAPLKLGTTNLVVGDRRKVAKTAANSHA
jgi:DNA-binding GntR family transcriptional regulator